MEVTLDGRALIGNELVKCCIGVEGGRIAAISKVLRGEDHYDYKDMLILPAAIDAHVHMREPGLTRKEDFDTGTLAAAFGGVSCVLDMPNTLPPVLSRGELEAKKEAIARKAWVDYGLFGGCAPGHNLLSMAPGVVGYKLYMASTTGEMLVREDDGIYQVLKQVKATGKVLSVHAEDERLIRKRREIRLEDHMENRPPESEVSAIRRLSSLTDYARIHVCHVSSHQALEALEGLPYTREVTPHHLLLSARRDLGGYGKANPPLRSETNRAALFGAFAEGRIDILASDHAPHTMDEKEFEDFDLIPSGLPGVETSLPLMLHLVKRGLLSIQVLMRASARRPAEIFGLNKGIIEIGKDADLMVVDPREVSRIKGERLHSKCGWTPYEDWDALFPRALFVRGRRLIDDHSVEGRRAGRDVIEPRATG